MVDIKKLEFHRIANIFPLMNEREFADLVEDIRVNGLRHPILIHEDKIADGRNRYNACLKLGIEPTFEKWNGEGTLAGLVDSLNYRRRNLSPSQKAIVAVKLADESKPSTGDTDTPMGGGLSQIQRAQLLNVSERNISRANQVVRDGVPEIAQMVEEGEMSVRAAADLVKLPKKEQSRIIKRGRKAAKRAIDKMRERSIKESKAASTCIFCSPGIEDSKANFSAALQILIELFPSRRRYVAAIVEELEEMSFADDLRDGYDLILSAIKAGRSEQSDCQKATKLPKDKFDIAIAEMLESGMIGMLQQGGKTAVARGARKSILFIKEKTDSDDLDDELDDTDSVEWI